MGWWTNDTDSKLDLVLRGQAEAARVAATILKNQTKVADLLTQHAQFLRQESIIATRRHAEIVSYLNRPKATLTFGKPQPKKELSNG